MGSTEAGMSVRAVVVHYRTPDLLERAVGSWTRFYPEVPLTIFDNAPDAASRRIVDRLRSGSSSIDLLSSPENVGHGPGMDQAIRAASQEYLFCLDSDTVVERGGFLEEMIRQAARPRVYGVGRRVRINDRGFNVEEGREGFGALDPASMLLRRETYLSLPPFIQHGQPVVDNFRSAAERNLELVDFPIAEYIRHEHRGTVDRHGYGLGLKGKINYLLNRLGF